jgi:hypothetical protein
MPLSDGSVILIGLVIVALLLVVLLAIRKGRGVDLTLEQGSLKGALSITEQKSEPDTQPENAKNSADAPRAGAPMANVDVLNQGEIAQSNVRVHLGHKIGPDAAPAAPGGDSSLTNVEALRQGKITQSKVDLHIGHDVKSRKGE